MSVSAWCLRSDSAVATTSSRQLGRCWKSPLGGIHFHSMRPTSSGSYTTPPGAAGAGPTPASRDGQRTALSTGDGADASEGETTPTAGRTAQNQGFHLRELRCE